MNISIHQIIEYQNSLSTGGLQFYLSVCGLFYLVWFWFFNVTFRRMVPKYLIHDGK